MTVDYKVMCFRGNTRLWSDTGALDLNSSCALTSCQIANPLPVSTLCVGQAWGVTFASQGYREK